MVVLNFLLCFFCLNVVSYCLGWRLALQVVIGVLIKYNRRAAPLKSEARRGAARSLDCCLPFRVVIGESLKYNQSAAPPDKRSEEGCCAEVVFE